MNTIKKAAAFLSLCLALAAAVNSVSAKPFRDGKDENRKQIVGTWQLKQTASNAKVEKIKTDKNEIRLVAPPVPNSLVLAADDNFGEITINEGFEKVIHTQTLPVNNNVAGGNLQDNGRIVKAFWQKKKLIVEALTVGGLKMTQTFELGANKNQLKVTLSLGGEKSRSVVARRVYNRSSDISGAEETPAEINISQYIL